MSGSGPEPKAGWQTLLGLAMVSAGVLAAQVVLSRLFGATVGYYYAFMLISLAMLGLGSGALIVYQFPRLYPPERLAAQAWALSVAAGVSCCIGTLIMLMVYGGVGGPHAFMSLAGIFLCFFPFFLFSGSVVSLVLIHARQHFARAYAADLIGAAAGCLAAVLLLNIAGPVLATLHVVSVMPIVGACLFAEGAGRPRQVFVALGLAFGMAV